MLTQDVLAFILSKMTQVYTHKLSKPRRDFLIELFRTLFAMRGRVNFTNLARFSRYSEQTFRRHFARCFDWVSFNLTIVRLRYHPAEPMIGVFDCSYLPKSGTKTYGLDRFFSHVAKARRPGLEVSILGCIAVLSRRVWTLDATQTPPGLSEQSAAPYSRIDFYLEQILDCLGVLPKVQYWVGDGYYAKHKVFNTLTGAGKHLITRLRSDANLRLVVAPERRRGRYGGKLLLGPWHQWEPVGRLDALPHVHLYTAWANSAHFKRDLRVVALVSERDGSYVILCSTDINQSADEVVQYYRLRYQLEFVIRDAKQFVGLSHCQARDQDKLDFHLNMSLAGVNVARLLCQQRQCSFNTLIREHYNRYVVEQLLDELGLKAEFDLKHPRIRRVIEIGSMAA